MGRSCDTFYRYQQLYENSGEATLQKLNRRKPNPKNHLPDYIEDTVLELAVANPALGQHRAFNELKHKV